jgi:NADPH-dependent 2,4-dienoyl-CoA reductase/sulfur reductase-like enzyme
LKNSVNINKSSIAVLGDNMEKNTDILVIGGGPAGIVCALTARQYYPDKKILVMRDVKKGVIPCGIPYMIASLEKPDQNIMGYSSLEKENIELVIDRAVTIDRQNKKVRTESGNDYRYEKLVLALGSNPIVPPIPGIDKKGVYRVRKDLDYLKEMVEEVKKHEKVLVIGGGFIGVEFADELSQIKGLEVILVEMLPHLLSNSFDPEFSELAEEKLRSQKVKILTNTTVEEFIGDEKVKKVRLSTGEKIDIDCVVLGVGTKPNTQLALDAGLELGKGKGIWVDEYLRTIDPDIFAVGDCAGKRDFFTRKDAPVLLASIATAEARIAGANLYQLKVLRENKGTIGIFSTYVGGLVMGSAGMTESTARREGFDIISGKAQVVDKHPSVLLGANKMLVKLVFSRESQAILGGQVAGGMSCGELINVIGIAIQKRFTITELETFQMATHPYLTAPPTMYPLVWAAQDAAKKR